MEQGTAKKEIEQKVQHSIMEKETIEQEKIIEAVLFTMGKSVEARQLSVALECSVDQAKKIARSLMQRYEKEQSAMKIIELENAFQMCTRPEYYDALIRVAKTPKRQVLTEAVLETLSIIAYKQPVTKTEIDHIRGVSSAYALNKLLEYGLIYEAGRLDAPGRPVLLATTEEFLRRFGVGSLAELPQMEPDAEAEIIHEVEEEMNYHFGIPEEEEIEDEEIGDEGIKEEEEDGN